jgi:predicted AAA+ superfamily ATPase
MERIYSLLIEKHIEIDNEMLFISGPRQVGKTTTSKKLGLNNKQFTYLNWDNEDHRSIILKGPKAVFEYINNKNQLTEQKHKNKQILVLDEIHKRPEWKNYLKGFFDTYGHEINIIVTGSARLDLYKKGGDSLMGRYFHYRMHPMSVAECIRTNLNNKEISKPKEISDKQYKSLYQFGGFPKPLSKSNPQFSGRWQNLRKQQLIQEDIRDVNIIHDLNKLQILMDFIKQNSSKQITYSNLAKLTRVSVDTIRRWIDALEAFYYCYRIKPWSKNISRSLIKEPKVFLWDWSIVSDTGSKTENFIASHLLKAVNFWTDRGLGNYDLYYIRTTEKKEIDFLVSKNDEPWFLVEVKHSNNSSISPNLIEFQRLSGAKHAFQVVFDLPFVDQDCFSITKPIIVPAKTFLSQLV